MRPLPAAVLAPFAALTGWVLWDVGFLGFYRWLLSSVAGWQLLADIVIALFLVLTWIRRDARRSGRRYWPWALLTVGLGSIGPLLYLATRPAEARRTSGVA